jgi:pimeloyl-ACP methyl ester carboxylesterase
MRRILISLCILTTVSAAIWFAGPRVALDETIHTVVAPADIDAWLVERESAFPDLVAGAEKRIVWANGIGQRTKRVFVYLHGFSASRQETAPLMDNLAGELGANLFETRLTGHGRSAEAMTAATVNAWLNDAVEALHIAESLGDEVTVVGVSTGGTLAWWLAAYAPERVDQLVLISPNFKLRSGGTDVLAGPWGAQLAQLLIGPERGFEPQNEAQAKYWTERYPTEALLPMFRLLKFIKRVPASDISQPVLAIYSPNDTVVDAQYTEELLAQLPESQLTRFVVEGADDPKQHVLAGDILSPNTTEIVAATISDYLQQRSGQAQ